MKREDCAALDVADPLAPVAFSFHRPVGALYFDGNSLGALPTATMAHLERVTRAQWGEGLISSWNAAGWIEAPARVGDKIARLIGAQPGEVVVADSTSVNLFKLLAGALAARPGRTVILTEEENFPTDQYVAEGLVRMLGRRARLRRVPRAEIESGLDEDVAVLALTHVDYRTAEIHDMVTLTRAAHQAGALALWDLSHSAGAVAVDLEAAQADLAVGCGYKYLNGGPGAPAYLYVARRHQDSLPPVISGWMGHAEPFAFESTYRPVAGIGRFVSGTPSILALSALESAIDLWLTIDLELAFAKGRALGDLFIRLVEERCHGLGFTVLSAARNRGSHVALQHVDAYPIVRALVDRGVIGDFRAPDVLRFGFAPLYTSAADLWDGVEIMREVVSSRSYDRPEYRDRLAVT